jgi:nitrite reductase/ring-hydroxylating ferredoxin subunit
MAFTKAATISEVPAGQGKPVTVNGKKVALFRVHDAFYAIEDRCPHRGAPLSEGDLDGAEVTCPWHAARLDVTTGKHLSPPANCGVATYKVQVVGDEIQVDV